MITAFSYTFASLALAGVVISYLIAFYLKSTVWNLSMFLFLLTVFCISLVIAINTWSTNAGIEYSVPLSELRGLSLMATSFFLLYTTWKKN